jgi:hypothetical protein
MLMRRVRSAGWRDTRNVTRGFFRKGWSFHASVSCKDGGVRVCKRVTT